MANQVPSVGRIVHYVLEDGRCKGEHRPAIIVKVWPEYNGIQLVQLQVFTDGTNDMLPGTGGSGTAWRTSVHHDEAEKKPSTYHWPEFVG